MLSFGPQRRSAVPLRFLSSGLAQFVALDQSWCTILSPLSPAPVCSRRRWCSDFLSLLPPLSFSLWSVYLVSVIPPFWFPCRRFYFLGFLSSLSFLFSPFSAVDHSGSVGSGQPLVNAIRTDSALIGGTAPFIFQHCSTFAQTGTCHTSFNWNCSYCDTLNALILRVFLSEFLILNAFMFCLRRINDLN